MGSCPDTDIDPTLYTWVLIHLGSSESTAEEG